MKIICDTREQTPWSFPHDIEVERGTLTSGDYSLAGLESMTAIERKSLPDFIGCCTGSNRARFKRELQRLKSYRCRAVIIEADFEAITGGQYRSGINPASVIGSMASWTVRYQIPFLLAGDAAGGAALCLALFRNYVNQLEEIASAVAKHSQKRA